MDKQSSSDESGNPVESQAGTGPLPVEIVSEGPHCVPCEYAISAVEYVAESYTGRIEVKVVETKQPKGAQRFLELCRDHGKAVPIPSILLNGRVAFEGIPGPEELCGALDEALERWETNK